MNSRRLFLTQATVIAGTAVLAKQVGPVSLARKTDTLKAGDESTLAVYHTNSINGNVGPVKSAGGPRTINTPPDNEPDAGLLLDAGNFLMPGGSFEEQKQLAATMSDAGYKAAGISGLDLSDHGQLLTALKPLMQFSLVNCNHRFTAAVKPFIKPYLVFKNAGIKIGVTAVCTPVKGAAYKNALECANRTARFLKEDERCHMVICLSDLGPAVRNAELNDQILAETSEHIDLIIGNDCGGFSPNNMVLRNKLKHEVIFSAAAAKGLTTGKTIVTFSGNNTKKGISIGHIFPEKTAGQKFGAASGEFSPGGSLLLT